MNKLFINAKCSDLCHIHATINNEEHVLDGYVPRFIGGSDYICLEIDIDTGTILDWNPELVKELMREQDD